MPANRFCPSCGTEIDEDARFCPTCGTPLDADEADQAPGTQAMPAASTQPGAGSSAQGAGHSQRASEPELPAAPLWPPPETDAPQAAPEPRAREPAPVQAPQPPQRPSMPAPPRAEAAPPRPAESADLPFTLPTTLSGWLIGGGSLLGALALIPNLDDAVSLVLFVALLAVAATVFLAERLPDVPRLRLIVLSVTLVGLGVAFDRAAFGPGGFDTVLFVAMIGAAGGALLIELDRDRPLPPPGGLARPSA